MVGMDWGQGQDAFCLSLERVKKRMLTFSLTGSFSFSILSGKIMFRDVVYITQDLSFR